MKSVGIVLSGCGVFDGSEIHESVLSLLSLTQSGAQVYFFAPDEPQRTVINHLSGEEKSEKRNMLEESARISRGQIRPLSEADASQLDALIVPGGFGAAKNLCDFAEKGAACEINKYFLSLSREMLSQGKPMGFICIAPVMIPKIVNSSVKLTIGNDSDTAAAIAEMGGVHVNCTVDNIVVDETHKIVTTPAYMLAENIAQAQIGIDKLVKKVLEMA